MAKREADLIGHFGARGSGKTFSAQQRVRKAPMRRLLVFDPVHQWGEFGTVTGSLQEVLAMMRNNGRWAQSFKIVYRPPDIGAVKIQDKRAPYSVHAFESLCRFAFRCEKMRLVGEELDLVTKAGWSGPHWQAMALRGRHAEIEAIGISQRPALVDKNFYSNASIIRTGRLNDDNDLKRLASALRVPLTEVAALVGYEAIERDMTTGAIVRFDEKGKKKRQPRRR